jgi:predicted RNA binding protein YcfA (HicA-like mRNA interferase family)
MMGAGFYAQIERILRENGCFFVRQGKGSHEIWQSSLSTKRFSLPVTVKNKITANAILKQAGIDKKF